MMMTGGNVWFLVRTRNPAMTTRFSMATALLRTQKFIVTMASQGVMMTMCAQKIPGVVLMDSIGTKANGPTMKTKSTVSAYFEMAYQDGVCCSEFMTHTQ